MNRDKYLTELGSYLLVLPLERRTKVLDFYSEHTQKLEADGKDLVETLGTPKELADNIVDMEATPFFTDKKEKRKKRHHLLPVILSFVGMFLVVSLGFSLFAKFTGNAIYWDKERHRFCVRSTAEHYVLEKTRIDEFDIINIRAGVATIYLIPSDGYYIEYNITSDAQMPYSVKNGHLNYDDRKKTYIRLGFYDAFTSDDEYVKIYYPAGAYILNVNATLDMGGLNIKDSVFTGKLDLELDMGSLTITNCKVNTLSADLDMGGINIKDSYIGTADLELDMGSANLSLCSVDQKNEPIDYGFDLETDMGSITLNGNKENKQFKSNGTSNIKISCDMGSITIKTE